MVTQKNSLVSIVNIQKSILVIKHNDVTDIILFIAFYFYELDNSKPF